MNRLMNYQDIHSSNIDAWQSFRQKYQSGDFAGAQTVAQALTNTQINAQALNDLFNFIVETEQLSDPTFKSDVIEVSATPPKDLQIGQMFFKDYSNVEAGDISLGITGAKVGQIIEIESVDEDGKPVSWKNVTTVKDESTLNQRIANIETALLKSVVLGE